MKFKTIAAAALAIVLLLVLTFCIGTWFMKRTDVVLLDYSVSEDGTQLTLRTGIVSSMGYTRGFTDEGGGIKPHYLIFYSTFGGLNSSFGAKNEFVLELGADDTEIYFNRPGGGYELVLQKDPDTGEWIRPDK
jgi:hypothetical protein